jgi:hypothetical protein
MVKLGLSKNTTLLGCLLWVSFPATSHLMELSYTDIISIFYFSLTLVAWAYGWFWMTGIALGLCMATKQTLFLAGGCFLIYVFRLLGWKKALQMGIVCGLIFLGIQLPFIFPDWNTYFNSSNTNILHLPVRNDAFTLTAILANFFDIIPSASFFKFLYLSIWAGACAFVFFKPHLRLHDVFIILGIAYFLNFYFAHGAFCNYYYFCLFWLLIGVMTSQTIFSSSKENDAQRNPTIR